MSDNTGNVNSDKILVEGNVKFVIGRAFYNPQMELNRTMSSLLVGALGNLNDKLKICDGFAASGIRGLRYVKENDNVELVNFVEANRRVCPVIEKNIMLNNLSSSAGVFCENILTHLSTHHEYNFIELDPFGTPAPYLHASVSSFLSNSSTKKAVLSVTATDTAVLHGAHRRATPKIYHSKPIHDMFLYEFGTRILLAHIARVAHEYDYKIMPLMSFSHRHYVKVICYVVRGAVGAREQELNNLGYVKFNPKTFEYHSIPLNQFYSQGLEKNNDELIGGLIYLSELHSPEVLKRMKQIAIERKEDRALKIINIMLNEKGLLYYDLHYMGKVLRLSSPKNNDVIDKLTSEGYYAAPTHFTPTGIRTDAPASEVVKVFKGEE
ncbi:hypothetical protein J7J90_03280 [Candidatus Micrarchaeota archaeon]|nr:hypothetical protein [Candidatus Micrarchaeota archaeon]